MNGHSPHSPETEKTPTWETLAMIASFALVWAYFAAFQSAKRVGGALHFGWNLALLAALGILIWVFVRRLKRVLKALKSQNQRR